MKMYSFGYVAVVGRPNAGKSSLVNALVGEKVAIVSSKPQTTRDNILGIMNGEKFQVVFVDTPGVHRSKNVLDKSMMKNVRSALSGVDLVLYLVDGTKEFDQEEQDYFNHIEGEKVLVKTKIDKKVKDFDCDFEISSLTGKNLENLKEYIIKHLPKSKKKNFLFESDEYTDKSIKFLIAEQIREEALKIFNDEVPHGIAVEIVKFDEKENIVFIEADIVCEQARHKGIIIGKGGKNLKIIGQNTRKYAEDLLGKKIMLTLFVKVEENWRNKPNKVKDLMSHG